MIDAADINVVLTFASIVLLSAIGVLALITTPWRRLERPAGLEDWRS